MRAALGAIVVVAAAVRVAFLWPPVRYDEAFSYLHYASQPWRTVVSDYSFPNNHILNSIEVHAVWRLFGDAPEVLRIPALVGGILLVPAVYLLGRLLYDRSAAVWGAALVGASSVLIQYSVNARGYAMGTLMVVVALSAATWAARTGALWAWILLGVSSVLAVYTLPTMAAGVAIAFLWALIVARGSPEFGRRVRDLVLTGAAAAVVSALLYLPTRGDAGWSYAPRVEDFGGKVDVLEQIWDQWNDALPLIVQVVLAAAFVVGVATHRRIAREPLPLALVALAVMVVVTLALPGSPLARTYMFLLPVYLLTAGAGLAWLVGLAAERVQGGRLPAEAANAAAAVVTCVALTLVFAVQGDDALTTDPPRSDDEIGQVIRPGVPFVSSLTTSDPTSFDLRKHGLDPPIFEAGAVPADARKVIMLVTPGTEETPESVMAATGIRPAPGTRPRLLRDTRWLDYYELELDR